MVELYNKGLALLSDLCHPDFMRVDPQLTKAMCKQLVLASPGDLHNSFHTGREFPGAKAVQTLALQ